MRNNDLIALTVALAGAITFGTALAQAGMWAYSIHICTSAGKCTEGIMTKDAPVFVSKTEREKWAKQFVNGLRSMGMVIKYVRCVQL